MRKLVEEMAMDEITAAIELHSTEHVSTLIGICTPPDRDELWFLFDLVEGFTFSRLQHDYQQVRAAIASSHATPQQQQFSEMDVFAMQVLVCLLRSLEYIHSRGVAHLDLTQANAMLCVNKRGVLSVRLIDLAARG